MNLKGRIDKLAGQLGSGPNPWDGRPVQELSDEELALVVAHGTSLSQEQVLALADDELTAIAGDGAKP